MLQLGECEHETAERWVSLLEVFRVYLVVRLKIKIVNPYIGGKCFANLLMFIWEVALSCQIIAVLILVWLNSDRKRRFVFSKMFQTLTSPEMWNDCRFKLKFSIYSVLVNITLECQPFLRWGSKGLIIRYRTATQISSQLSFQRC